MPSVRIGTQTQSFRRPLRRALEAAGRAGADGVLIDLRTELPYADLSQTALRQLRKLLDDLGLTVGAAAFPLRRGLGDPADLERRVAAVTAAMSAAAQLGARVLLAPIGPLPEDPASPDDESSDRDRLLQTLMAVGTHGDRVGARLAVSPGAEPAGRVADLLGELPAGVVGVDFNPARLLAAGHDPRAAVEALGASILHAHANDAVRDLAAGGGGGQQVVNVPLGRGSVDMPELFASLEQHEYRGWITIEGSGAPDPESELGNAVAYLRTLQRGG